MRTEEIAAPSGRPFRIPSDPENTRDHARWICEQVFEGEYDHPELPSDIRTAIDIGSHVGSFAVWAAKRWPMLVRIDCYDPNELACDIAAANVAGLGQIVDLHSVAVTEQPVAYFGLPWDWGSAKTHQLQATEGFEVTTLHPRDLPAAELLKCDSEGTEIEVLNHYQHWGTLKALLVEFHNPNHRVAQRKIATARGFRCLREQDHPYGVAIWIPA